MGRATQLDQYPDIARVFKLPSVQQRLYGQLLDSAPAADGLDLVVHYQVGRNALRP